MTTPQVGIVGMAALRRDMARLGADMGPMNKALSAAGRVAAEPIAAAVRESVPRGETGKLSGSVRVTASKTGAAVRMGRASAPYAGPVDFGGYPEGREYMASGRFLFPAAEPLANHAASLYSAAVQRALDSFNWTNESATTAHD